MPALDRPKTEIAKLLGVSRQTLYDVLQERQPVTPGMALWLGKLCANGPDLWLNLQKRHDLHRAQQETRREDQENSDLGSRVSRGPKLSALSKRSPDERSDIRESRFIQPGCAALYPAAPDGTLAVWNH